MNANAKMYGDTDSKHFTAKKQESDNSQFRKELEILINSHSMENGSDTPDFILAEYLSDCLEAFDKAVSKRTAWQR